MQSLKLFKHVETNDTSQLMLCESIGDGEDEENESEHEQHEITAV